MKRTFGEGAYNYVDDLQDDIANLKYIIANAQNLITAAIVEREAALKELERYKEMLHSVQQENKDLRMHNDIIPAMSARFSALRQVEQYHIEHCKRLKEHKEVQTSSEGLDKGVLIITKTLKRRQVWKPKPCHICAAPDAEVCIGFGNQICTKCFNEMPKAEL